MPAHLRKQIRDAAATVLTGLTTSASRVYESRTEEMQAVNLPGLRIYTNDEEIDTVSLGPSNRAREHKLQLVVEACSRKLAAMDDELDAMIKEVTVALDSNQGLGVGVKSIEPKGIEIQMEGEADEDVGVARMTFEVLYYTAQGAPDVAL